MNRQITLIVFTLVLGAIYLFYFTDLFSSPRPMQVYAQIRPAMSGRWNRDRNRDSEKNHETFAVSFTLDAPYAIKEIKVVDAEDYKTNKYAHILWHMISDSNSAPMKGFIYGSKIAGMKPGTPRGRAELLQPNSTYLLLLDAGKTKGEVPFKTRPSPQRS